MEKLSSILPASPRIKSVDLSEAKPRRPGGPNFGVPEGSTSSMRDKVSLSSRAPVETMKENVTYNPKEFKSSKMAEDITRKFFETRLNPTDKETTKSESVVDGLDEKLEDASIAELEQASQKATSSESRRSDYPLE